MVGSKSGAEPCVRKQMLFYQSGLFEMTEAQFTLAYTKITMIIIIMKVCAGSKCSSWVILVTISQASFLVC
jgi:hypothetical protein